MWMGETQEGFLEVVPLVGFSRQSWDEKRRYSRWSSSVSKDRVSLTTHVPPGSQL